MEITLNEAEIFVLKSIISDYDEYCDLLVNCAPHLLESRDYSRMDDMRHIALSILEKK